MKPNKLAAILVAILSIGTFGPIRMAAADATTQPSTQPAPVSAQFDKSASDRADSIVRDLQIDESAKAARVHDIITSQLVALHQWHQTNDAQVKQLTKAGGGQDLDRIEATRHDLHNAFLAKLSAELTPDQIDTVKEKLTGGQMTATLRNYPEIIPNLTDDDKAMIAKTLLEAREEAMDSGSRTERIAIFKKFKGKINVYLDAHGHDVKQAYKDWGAAQKAKQAAAASEPSSE
jgi:Protein of unknown function (DUF3826)